MSNNVVAVLLARGGSKGIPKKNIIDFCGKPLIAWTIEQLQKVDDVQSIWVSSDSEEILEVGEKYGARSILRPDTIAGDTATSESAWLHALDLLESSEGPIDIMVAPQVTSPLRHWQDFKRGIDIFLDNKYDSLFSCSIAEDLLYWEKQANGSFQSKNYDYKNRKRRQDFPLQYIENGSFYLFKPEVLRAYNNRFGDNIGLVEMEFWKMFEIDSLDDLKMCQALMKAFLL